MIELRDLSQWTDIPMELLAEWPDVVIEGLWRGVQERDKWVIQERQ